MRWMPRGRWVRPGSQPLAYMCSATANISTSSDPKATMDREAMSFMGVSYLWFGLDAKQVATVGHWATIGVCTRYLQRKLLYFYALPPSVFPADDALDDQLTAAGESGLGELPSPRQVGAAS